MEFWSERAYPTPVSSSPLLPWLLIALATQKHTPKTTSKYPNELEEYDYVIVGGGTAGAVVAGRLSEDDSISVLLLEAGKLPPRLTDLPIAATSFLGSDIDWKYTTEPQYKTGDGIKDRIFPWPNGKTLGGSSTINGMFAVRGNRKNFDDWAANGATGWNYENVLPYFIKLENYTDIKFRDNGFHGTKGPQSIEKIRYFPRLLKAFDDAAKMHGYPFVDVNGPSQIGFYNLRDTSRSGQRCSTAKAYLVPVDGRENLDILPNAMVTKIVIRNRRATGVLFDFEGESYEVRARKEVIIAAGAVESPKLLMLSGIGPEKELRRLKIDVIADLPVGENLQDHVSVPVNFALDENIIIPYNKRVTDYTIMQYIRDRTGPLSISYGATLTYFLRNLSPTTVAPNEEFDESDYQSNEEFDETDYQSAEDFDVSDYQSAQDFDASYYQSDEDFDVPDYQSDEDCQSADFGVPDYQTYILEFTVDNNIQSFFNLKQEVYEKVYAPYEDKPIFLCETFASNPKSRGTLRLRSINPYDKPLIDPRYFDHPLDMENTIAGMKTCLELGRSSPLLRLGSQPFETVYPGCHPYVIDSDDYLRCTAKTISSTAYHYAGTVKMGSADDPTAVVDPRLRVKTICGLRVVGAAIMPTITSGNTNLPTIMIAEKAADMIKQDKFYTRVNCDIGRTNIHANAEVYVSYHSD